MTDPIDQAAIFLRALPHLPEVVLPVIGAMALLGGMLAGRVYRRRVRTRRRKPRPVRHRALRQR